MEKYRNLICLLGGLLVFYFLSCFFFFFLIGKNSVEYIIGFSFLFLVYLIYKRMSAYIYYYLWNLSKDVWLHYASLLFILKSTREMILSLNRSYLSFLRNKLILFNTISVSLDSIWSELNLALLEKYLSNNVLKQLLSKYSLVYINTKNANSVLLLEMNLLYRVKNFSIYNLVLFLRNYNNY